MLVGFEALKDIWKTCLFHYEKSKWIPMMVIKFWSISVWNERKKHIRLDVVWRSSEKWDWMLHFRLWRCYLTISAVICPIQWTYELKWRYDKEKILWTIVNKKIYFTKTWKRLANKNYELTAHIFCRFQSAMKTE